MVKWYLKTVWDRYLKIFYSENDRDMVLIYANRPEDEVLEEIKSITLERLQAVIK